MVPHLDSSKRAGFVADIASAMAEGNIRTARDVYGRIVGQTGSVLAADALWVEGRLAAARLPFDPEPWTCFLCGREHDAAVYRCECGRSYPPDNRPWECHCGKGNDAEALSCRCGAMRPKRVSVRTAAD
jgi:hypothetical protein